MSEKNQPSQDQIDPKAMFQKIKANRYWFLLGIIISLVAAYFVAATTQPEWKIRSKILVQDQHSAGGTTRSGEGFSGFTDLLTFQSSADNELQVLKTRQLVNQVVNKLQLNITIYQNKGLKKLEVFDEAPFSASMRTKRDFIGDQTFIIQNLTDESFRLRPKNGKSFIDIRWGVPYENHDFILLLQKTRKISETGTYEITVSDVNSTEQNLMKRFDIKLSEKPATVIDLTLDYPHPIKGALILQEFMNIYLQDNMDTKVKVDDSASRFISERLNVVGKELAALEGRTEKYQSDNEVVDLNAQSTNLITGSGEQTSKINKQEVQIKVVEDLENVLNLSESSSIPAALAIENDPSIIETIKRYNDLLASKQKLTLSYKEDNPIVQNVNSQISDARSTLLSSLALYKKSLLVSQNQLALQQNTLTNKIKQVPIHERTFMDYSREQKLKETVYLYLLQKKEETDIAKTSTNAASRIIDPAKSDTRPFKPSRTLLYPVFMFFGLLIPFLMILIREALNMKIKSVAEIESLTKAPVIGEIGHSQGGKMIAFHKDSRSAISEHFRTLRANLQFITGQDSGKLIMLTSSFSGEGKTFISLNLGMALALIGKRVLFMEMDLRKPNLAKGMNLPPIDRGISSYLSSENEDYHSIIHPTGIHENCFIIPAGRIPSNPSELLLSKKVSILIEKLRHEFDYLIIDNAPAGLVSDTVTLGKFADITLYVVRNNVTMKNSLRILNDMINKGSMKDVYVVINDIETSASAHRYGQGVNNGYYIEEPKKFMGLFKS